MIILGIDPGLATTGWGVIDFSQDRARLKKCGIIRTPAGEYLAERLLAIHQDLTRLIRTYRPERMAVEQLFFNTNTKTAFLVSQARGVVLLTAALQALPVSEFTPLQIKMNIVGYGQAEKTQIQSMVQQMLGLKTAPHPDDAADALAVALTCAYRLHSYDRIP